MSVGALLSTLAGPIVGAAQARALGRRGAEGSGGGPLRAARGAAARMLAARLGHRPAAAGGWGVGFARAAAWAPRRPR